MYCVEVLLITVAIDSLFVIFLIWLFKKHRFFTQVSPIADPLISLYSCSAVLSNIHSFIHSFIHSSVLWNWNMCYMYSNSMTNIKLLPNYENVTSKVHSCTIPFCVVETIKSMMEYVDYKSFWHSKCHTHTHDSEL